MAITDVSICNSALLKIGAERILSLDDNTNRAKVLKEQYEKVRDEMLYSHPWNFATKRVELAAILTPPSYEWSNQFQLPTDCLRVYGTDLPKNDDWKVEDTFILCNSATLKIKYIARVTSAAKFSPAFAEALAARLAFECSYLITQSAALKEVLAKDAEKKLREARSYDAQESQGDRVYADSWLNSRA